MRTRMWFIVCSMLVAVWGNAYAGNPVTLELTRDGKPAATIVVAEKPTRAAQLAAAELQEHIRAITGATLPMVSDASKTTGLRILVGESKATQALGLKSTDFKPQEYLIRFRPNLLVLMGRDKEDFGRLDYANPDGKTLPDMYDDQATGYAVYDFLERCCGVRWYLATDLGLVCPNTPTLRVTGADRRRTPWMEHRQLMGWSDNSGVTGWTRYPQDFVGTALTGQPGGTLPWREQALYGLRLRNGGRKIALGGHSYYSYYPRFWGDSRYPQFFERKRPELFAQGYRVDPPPQMCYTSPELLQQTVQDARDFFNGKEQNRENNEGSVGRDYFIMGAMDNCSYCKCPRCNAILRTHVPPGSSQYDGDQSVSDYWFGFVNQVAREIRKTHPDKYLSAIAYNAYINLPHEPVEPNVAITMVLAGTSHRLWNTQETEKYRKVLDDWVRQSPARPKYVWLHWLFPVSWAAYANPPWKPFPGFAAHRIVDEMRRYRADGIRGLTIETSTAPPCCSKVPLWDQLELYVAARLADDPDQDGNKLIDEFFERYYGAAAKPMKSFYELIEEVYSNPNNYPDGASSQTPYIAWECLGTEARMDKLERMMDEARTAGKTDLERKRVDLFDRGIWQVMCAGRKEWLEVRAKTSVAKPSAKAPCVTATQDVDPRKLDWKQAGVLADWSTFDGKPTDRKIDARIAHDGRNLYLRLQDRMDTTKIVRDPPEWAGDDWEIFVARRASGGEAYRQIGIDAKGFFADLSYNLVDQGIVHECGARVWSDTGAPDCWSVFVAIPIAQLLPGAEQAKAGDNVCLNIVRATHGSVPGAALWSPTMVANFHAVDRLGKVALLLPGSAHENLVKQPGFEEVTPLTEASEEWLEGARGAGCILGETWAHGWIPQVWASQCKGEMIRIVEGTPGKEVHSGKRALQVNGGKEGMSLYQSETGKGPNGRYHCGFYGRGSGKIALQTYEYWTKSNACPANHGIIQTFVLTPEWQKYEGIYQPSPKSDAQFNLVVGVAPGTEATLDDFEFWEE